MSTKLQNVFTGAPDQLVTGAILRAPLGTALPATIVSTLDPAFNDSGYIGPDGLKLTPNTKLSDIKDWSGTTIRKILDEFNAEMAWSHLELSSEALKVYFGDGNVTTTAFNLPLATPVLTLGTTATTGGTLAAGQTYWKITAINAQGETVGSNEVTALLTGATSTQVLSWATVPSATGFRVYRGTAPGAENKLVATLGVVTTYTDTGAAGTTASVPTVDTSGNGTRQVLKLNGQDMPICEWVFKIKDGVRKILIVVPLGQIIERGEMVFDNNKAVMLPVKMTTYPDASGNNVYVYTDNGVYTA